MRHGPEEVNANYRMRENRRKACNVLGVPAIGDTFMRTYGRGWRQIGERGRSLSEVGDTQAHRNTYSEACPDGKKVIQASDVSLKERTTTIHIARRISVKV